MREAPAWWPADLVWRQSSSWKSRSSINAVIQEAKRFNVLQKFAYLAVVFLLLPAMVLTGLTMSPGVDAAVLVIKRRDPPVLSTREFERYAAFVRQQFEIRSGALKVETAAWADEFRARP